MGRARPTRHLATQSSDQHAIPAAREVGDRRFLTDEEFAAAQKSAEDHAALPLGAIPQADAGQATRRDVVDDRSAKRTLPGTHGQGKDLYDQMRGSYKPGQTVFDSPEDFDSWDRCITRGLPVSMLPRNYNAASASCSHRLRDHPSRDGPRGRIIRPRSVRARWFDQAVSR